MECSKIQESGHIFHEEGGTGQYFSGDAWVNRNVEPRGWDENEIEIFHSKEELLQAAEINGLSDQPVRAVLVSFASEEQTPFLSVPSDVAPTPLNYDVPRFTPSIGWVKLNRSLCNYPLQ